MLIAGLVIGLVFGVALSFVAGNGAEGQALKTTVITEA
jgi:hypothetical protein